MTLREPVHVFSIPLNIAESLANKPGPRLSYPEPEVTSVNVPDAPSTGSLACTLCLGAAFADVLQQRNHFRSDWHRYNVKTRLQDPNSTPVSEPQFANLVEGLEDSLSGSASSSSGDDASSDDAVSTLIQKQKKLRVRSESPSDEPVIPKSPILWFQSPEAPNTQLGIYSTLFPASMPSEHYASALREMQEGGPNGRTWALFMTAGGHFAGMVARVSRPGVAGTSGPTDTKSSHKKKKPQHQPDLEIISHKTFHRYTTRRKQGGSQSVNDNAKGPAKSAGAQLRRYGEQALREDIEALLVEWAEELHGCERIFIRASVSNRRIFLDSEHSPIKKGDDRLRTFPFQTRRPTLSELTRCLQELTKVKITHLTEEELRAADSAFIAFLQSKVKARPIAVQAPETKKDIKDILPKLSAEEVAIRDRWRKLLEMIRKGRLEALRAFWASTDTLGEHPLGNPERGDHVPLVDTHIPGWLREEEGKSVGTTLLQLASAAGQDSIVQWLLVEKHADPTVPVPSTFAAAPREDIGDASDEEAHPEPTSSLSTLTVQKAYDLATTRATRAVFRRAAYTFPDWWDWLGQGLEGARIPSVLSPDMEESEQKKKGVRRKGLKERMKERRAEEESTSAAATANASVLTPAPEVSSSQQKTGPQRLGGPGSGGHASAAMLDAMTPEMRARIERERRARAAEARFRNQGNG